MARDQGACQGKDRQQKRQANDELNRAKRNLTNKTEVNLLRKPKSMAQPHPDVKLSQRWGNSENATL